MENKITWYPPLGPVLMTPAFLHQKRNAPYSIHYFLLRSPWCFAVGVQFGGLLHGVVDTAAVFIGKESGGSCCCVYVASKDGSIADMMGNW